MSQYYRLAFLICFLTGSVHSEQYVRISLYSPAFSKEAIVQPSYLTSFKAKELASHLAMRLRSFIPSTLPLVLFPILLSSHHYIGAQNAFTTQEEMASNADSKGNINPARTSNSIQQKPLTIVPIGDQRRFIIPANINPSRTDFPHFPDLHVARDTDEKNLLAKILDVSPQLAAAPLLFANLHYTMKLDAYQEAMAVAAAIYDPSVKGYRAGIVLNTEVWTNAHIQDSSYLASTKNEKTLPLTIFHEEHHLLHYLGILNAVSPIFERIVQLSDKNFLKKFNEQDVKTEIYHLLLAQEEIDADRYAAAKYEQKYGKSPDSEFLDYALNNRTKNLGLMQSAKNRIFDLVFREKSGSVKQELEHMLPNPVSYNNSKGRLNWLFISRAS